jgi:hypothetical protein
MAGIEDREDERGFGITARFGATGDKASGTYSRTECIRTGCAAEAAEAALLLIEEGMGAIAFLGIPTIFRACGATGMG